MALTIRGENYVKKRKGKIGRVKTRKGKQKSTDPKSFIHFQESIELVERKGKIKIVKVRKGKTRKGKIRKGKKRRGKRKKEKDRPEKVKKRKDQERRWRSEKQRNNMYSSVKMTVFVAGAAFRDLSLTLRARCSICFFCCWPFWSSLLLDIGSSNFEEVWHEMHFWEVDRARNAVLVNARCGSEATSKLNGSPRFKTSLAFRHASPSGPVIKHLQNGLSLSPPAINNLSCVLLSRRMVGLLGCFASPGHCSGHVFCFRAGFLLLLLLLLWWWWWWTDGQSHAHGDNSHIGKFFLEHNGRTVPLKRPAPDSPRNCCDAIYS